MTVLFIRLIDETNKGAALKRSIYQTSFGNYDPSIYIALPNKFSDIPKSPFAYWVKKEIRQLFKKFPPFKVKGRNAKQGLATADDFRFLRLWWEVSPKKIVSLPHSSDSKDYVELTYSGKKWIFFAKGGEFSPFYADIQLIVNWEKNGEEIKKKVNPKTQRPYSNVWMLKDTEQNYFFQSGFTWTLRTTSKLSFRILPSGTIFGHKGPSGFTDKIIPTLCVMQSYIYQYLIDLQMPAIDTAARSYEVGVIQRTPIPMFDETHEKHLITIFNEIVNLKRGFSNKYENEHHFTCPLFCTNSEISLNESFHRWNVELRDSKKIIDVLTVQLNKIIFELYKIPQEYQDEISHIYSDLPHPLKNISIKLPDHTASLVSYLLGCIFGRWDIRYATGEKASPPLPDPFDPLPACSPGMLQGEDGLPLLNQPDNYPITIDADGILVDDDKHQDDIINRISSIIQEIWRDRSDEIEKEICEILKINSLRNYFRKETKGGFWNDHLTRYSNSRRTAPIYWLLQSDKKNYAVWIYYHRYDHDTLFKVIERYVKPKINGIERHLDELKAKKTSLPQTDPSYKKTLAEIEEQEDLLAEMNRFADKIQKVTYLSFVPDLDDGVVLTAAPLWEVIPWKDLADYWKELLEGKYEWSSIGKQLREKGLVKG